MGTNGCPETTIILDFDSPDFFPRRPRREWNFRPRAHFSDGFCYIELNDLNQNAADHAPLFDFDQGEHGAPDVLLDENQEQELFAEG